MDYTTWLAIIGIILTVIFGIPYVIKKKRYPGKITFIKQSSIGLFDSIVKNFSEISILYNNNPIKENLVYIKGCFLNDGDIDIEGEKIEKSLNVGLPENYKWINCNITKASKDFNCRHILKGSNELQFEFGLFRKNEFYQMEAIIEAPMNNENNSNNILNILKFNHRIPHTQKIKAINILPEDQVIKMRRNMFNFILRASLIFLLPFIIAIVLVMILTTGDLIYRTTENKMIYEYKASPNRDGFIELNNVNKNENKTISLSEFQDKSNYIPFIKSKTIKQKINDIWFVPFIIAITILILATIDYYRLRKSYKINRIINASD
jgi:hypothetical protein